MRFCCSCLKTVVSASSTYKDDVVGAGHHGDQQVDQHNDDDDRVAAEHEQGPESGELRDSGQLEVLQVDQPEHGPEQRLACLKQTVNVASQSVGIQRYNLAPET